MYDKAVRRRRAVLAVLVALSLTLLTAYFGESSSGGLHSVQRGAMEVLAPIQEGANRVVKPFRDLFGWFGDTLDAKDERDKLKKERDALRQEVTQLQVDGAENEQLRGLLEINSGGGMKAYEPVIGRVFARSPSTWYSTVEINKGSSDGVKPDQPVINGEGLVGKVKSVSDGNAIVMLLTDQEFGVSAKAARSGEPGSIDPAVGAPGDLLLELVPRGKLVTQGRADRHRRHGLDAAEVAVPARDPDRDGAPRRRGRGRARPPHPRAPGRRPAPARVRRGAHEARHRPARLDDAVTVTGPAIARLVALGLLGGILQLTAVAQITVFGVPADLSPLLVASVGLLMGSVPGALFGFGIGLFADTALLQTLGISSLVLTAVGYWAGRLRELRDPAHGLVPVAVGAAATAAYAIGFSVMQFLLGVDAPISLLLVRQILLVIVLNTLLALPVYLLVRRVLSPFLPDDPRRRRRRAYTTGGLSPLSRA